jgi:hypothetical protein
MDPQAGQQEVQAAAARPLVRGGGGAGVEMGHGEGRVSRPGGPGTPARPAPPPTRRYFPYPSSSLDLSLLPLIHLFLFFLMHLGLRWGLIPNQHRLAAAYPSSSTTPPSEHTSFSFSVVPSPPIFSFQGLYYALHELVN